jgi:hypothetical protein
MITSFAALLATLRIQARGRPVGREPVSLTTILAGLRYI